ncbi:hypothetical protein ACFFS2_22340 [Streptomyces aurantiacus]|uniref:Secreted protein n=1 Tax=Streptomyces aurantiacus TaxID=47760 RepID=A0A7G1PBU8_9ACTN|nr:hypothetical protein [Streptomyces aurantiacus]BCL30545.1 hypothetical protein GCM10017557_54040 [Streptomyces aurantiacus]
MKSTTRGTFAAVVTCVAAAVATPAVAADGIPVAVPLEGAEHALDMELPSVSGTVPLLKPGSPDGPRYVEGRLLPDRALPQLPVTSDLPSADLRTPVPRVLGDTFDHLAVGAPTSSGLRARTPGASLDGPLTAPRPDRLGLPAPKLPEAGLLAPVLQAAPGATLGLAPGL